MYLRRFFSELYLNQFHLGLLGLSVCSVVMPLGAIRSLHFPFSHGGSISQISRSRNIFSILNVFQRRSFCYHTPLFRGVLPWSSGILLQGTSLNTISTEKFISNGLLGLHHGIPMLSPFRLKSKLSKKTVVDDVHVMKIRLGRKSLTVKLSSDSTYTYGDISKHAVLHWGLKTDQHYELIDESLQTMELTTKIPFKNPQHDSKSILTLQVKQIKIEEEITQHIAQEEEAPKEDKGSHFVQLLESREEMTKVTSWSKEIPKEGNNITFCSSIRESAGNKRRY
jgi:hypothetical protein